MPSNPPFVDRDDAGEKLADELETRSIDADIVLAIPRGGLPLGRAVADRLDIPLDIVVAKKIGAPGNPEYAIGAVASDGSIWRNEDAFTGGRVDESYFEQKRDEEAANAKEKARMYRGDRPEPDVENKTVIVVDDGVATGSTVHACLAKLRNQKVGQLIIAVPVGPPSTIEQLDADEVICLETPRSFMGVGQFYERFVQVSDAEAMTYLQT